MTLLLLLVDEGMRSRRRLVQRAIDGCFGVGVVATEAALGGVMMRSFGQALELHGSWGLLDRRAEEVVLAVEHHGRSVWRRHPRRFGDGASVGVVELFIAEGGGVIEGKRIVFDGWEVG